MPVSFHLCSRPRLFCFPPEACVREALVGSDPRHQALLPAAGPGSWAEALCPCLSVSLAPESLLLGCVCRRLKSPGGEDGKGVKERNVSR